MMLIDASCPSNRLAAVTKRTGWAGRWSVVSVTGGLQMSGGGGQDQRSRAVRVRGSTVRRMSSRLSFDPIAEAHRQWRARWPEHAEHMAAVTSIMRVQQLLIGEVERVLKPHQLTFASTRPCNCSPSPAAASSPWGRSVNG
jgi:hypothetical protein